MITTDTTELKKLAEQYNISFLELLYLYLPRIVNKVTNNFKLILNLWKEKLIFVNF
jgi:hypothetical protein